MERQETMRLKPIRVLIIDDSAVIRTMLSNLLNREADIDICGTATDAYDGRDKVLALQPDVIILDVEMPRMDGLTFLEKLMKGHPLPVIMCSSSTGPDTRTTISALEKGAIDVAAKPVVNTGQAMNDLAAELAEKIRAAADIQDIKRHYLRQQGALRLRQQMGGAHWPGGAGASQPAPASRPLVTRRPEDTQSVIRQQLPPGAAGHVIAIGASTGGTEAIREVLVRLPAWTPPLVIVQHMPENFTSAFASRLNDLCEIEVREARDGDDLRTGLALLAPGGFHMTLQRGGPGGFRVKVQDGPLVCRHKPSVEMLFNSVADVAGGRAIGVMLTGMGADGSVAMKRMRDSGARNIAQDESTCVVFGMPKEAIRLGAIDKVVPIDRVARTLLDMLS